MKKEIPQKKARKKYVKPELTKHKSLRKITMAPAVQGQCGTCYIGE